MDELQDSYSLLIVSIRLPSNSIANITPTHFIKTNIKVITYFVGKKWKNAGAYQMNLRHHTLWHLPQNLL